jgi:hypothetical protein
MTGLEPTGLPRGINRWNPGVCGIFGETGRSPRLELIQNYPPGNSSRREDGANASLKQN